MIIKNTREVGNKKEREAEIFLQELGYETVAKNFTTKFGEIDLIVKKGEYLIFVEVKYQARKEISVPSAKVNRAKQERIKKTAFCFLQRQKEEYYCRYDVIEIIGEEINHFVGAFM